MSGLTELDVVNDCLAALGEFPVNSVSEGHPLIPAALRALKTANQREQAKSWWFNRELVDLAPDVDGHVFLPNDVLKVDPQSSSQSYVARGRRLYKPFEPTVANKYTFTETVRVWLVREVPFEDCPITAQMLVSYSAQLDFMKSYEADNNKYGQVTQLYRDTLITLGSEHVRASGVNMLNRAAIFNGRTDVGVTQLSGLYRPHS